jgi:hypothetical protein
MESQYVDRVRAEQRQLDQITDKQNTAAWLTKSGPARL